MPTSIDTSNEGFDRNPQLLHASQLAGNGGEELRRAALQESAERKKRLAKTMVVYGGHSED